MAPLVDDLPLVAGARAAKVRLIEDRVAFVPLVEGHLHARLVLLRARGMALLAVHRILASALSLDLGQVGPVEAVRAFGPDERLEAGDVLGDEEVAGAGVVQVVLLGAQPGELVAFSVHGLDSGHVAVLILFCHSKHLILKENFVNFSTF